MIKKKATAGLALTVAAMLTCPGLPVFADQAATVTYLEGTADYRPSSGVAWQPLKKTTAVGENQTVRTGKNGYVELTLPDGSILRLAPDTEFHIDTSLFPANKPRRFSARLLLGKLWARVTRSIQMGSGSFRTATSTAVAGVRGTLYDLRTAEARGTDIWVYEGVVAVGPAVFEQDGPKEEIAWPKEVSERQWEEIIVGKLQKLHIGPDGTPDKPTAFEPVKEEDDWASWNRRRDLLPR